MRVAKLSSDGTKEENTHLREENEQLRHMLEERDAELAMIQSVQEGLASGLNVQAIYDLVGDKIREIFNADTTFIVFKDVERKVITTVYYADKEKKITFERPYGLGLAEIIMESGQPLLIKTAEEQAKYPVFKVASPGAQKDRNISVLGCPITINGQSVGVVSVQNYAEYAFHENDQRLLITLANSMSVALESARLFDETQRLLRETEQRNAELEIINSVQEGLASKLDIQAIYELVGDKIRKIFHNADAEIRIYDLKTNLIHIPYITDMGTRIVVDAIPLTDVGMSSYVLRTGKTLVINENLMQEMEKYGTTILPGGHPAKSAVFVPLVVGNQARGLIVLGDVEREHAFSESDVRLLQTLANSMSTALENARLFDETQNLLRETEQRNAELAIINSVQEGLASKLDMQSIYDLVGDKIRDLFNAQSVWIQMYDQATRTRQFRYGFYRQRLYIPEMLPFNKLTEHLIATKKPLVINQNADARKAEFEMVIVAGSEMFKSAIFVPLISGGEVKGTITLQNMEQENAFSESDINLLSTLASSMSVGLENARLFDETEQRNAELAIINSVQKELAEGVASKRDIQAIYDLVGDKICELFPNTDTEIRIYDPKTDLIHFPYFIDDGKRVTIAPIRLADSGISSYILRTRQTLVIHENFLQEVEKFGSTIILMDGGHLAKSAVFVPLVVENQARGLIVLSNVEREHAFSSSDVRLFETLANSMSTALENARLFDETQRLLKETEQRAAELQIINSVQEGLVSRLDMQAIYDLVGDKIRDLFSAQSVWILTFDRVARTRRVEYSFENGQRYYASDLLPFNKLTEYLIATKRTLVINQDADARIAGFEMSSVAGTQRFKSAIFVPLITDGEVKGFISLQNIEKENAFSESDISLLFTLASSMSVALENARLFDETQRLLKETEQRAAELSIITSVQEGLSSKLDMQAIYELVGDKMQEIFDAQSLLILTFDHAKELAHITYNREKGVRYYANPYPFTGLHRYIIQSRNTVVINEDSLEWQAKFGMVQLPGTEQSKSMIFVPLTSGYRVSGMISIQNLEREHAFSDTDVRLLETLASSMSVALENANLFDETQRLFLEAKEARTAAEQANQAKSAFLSSMSHELRTPLNAIINFVEMVARGMIGPVNQEQVELLEQSLHSSKHLLNLINDVLDISKIQAGQLTLFIEDDVSVQIEVEAALNIVGGLIQEKGLQLIRDIDPHLPMISCDRRRLRQVLLNLISNAIKFTQEGTVTMSVKNQGKQLLFAVIDTGLGIPRDKQDLIFEPFIQAENGERQLQGTGLGLPISRSLIRAHGGELWVDSEGGEGSAFFFTLPVERRSSL